jgi:uncharacterized repeat protein (TIGR04052 family)
MKPASAIAAALLLAACAAPIPPAETAAPVTIRFAAEFAGKPFACGQSYSLGTPAAMVTPTDLRLYVSEVALVRADGTAVPLTLDTDNRWQANGVALLDFEDGAGPCAAGGSAATNTALRGTAPAGSYIGLRFTVGVPVAQNHQDATIAGAPLNVTAMFWNWQNGYKFLKADFAVPGAAMHGAARVAAPGHSPGQGFALHIGSTQCAAAAPTRPGTDCRNANRMAIVLDGFEAARDVVVLDLAPALERNDLRRNTAGTPPGCMSFPNDPECRSVMPNLGLAYADAPAGAQRVFAARRATTVAAR